MLWWKAEHEMQTALLIRPDDLSGDATRRLIARHLRGMHDSSPPESIHALDVESLRDPTVSFWSAWVGEDLAGIGALKRLDAERSEIKSMRVDDRFRGQGIGRALLRHIIEEARARGVTSLWLETGSSKDFDPARRLYASEGFTKCRPFGHYVLDAHSTFMTRALGSTGAPHTGDRCVNARRKSERPR